MCVCVCVCIRFLAPSDPEAFPVGECGYREIFSACSEILQKGSGFGEPPSMSSPLPPSPFQNTDRAAHSHVKKGEVQLAHRWVVLLL